MESTEKLFENINGTGSSFAALETDAVEERVHRILFDESGGVEAPDDNEELCSRAGELYDKEDYGNAARLFARAALNGHARSQYMLGMMYREGKGVRYDSARAMVWIELAACQGYAAAQYRMGYYYNFGKLFVKKDEYKLAYNWYMKAAAQGYAQAYLRIGVLYILGCGVKTDFRKAHEYIQKAAELGDAEALYRVGCYYYDGDGVQKDRTTAAEYFRKAYRAGYEAAGKRMRKLGISPDEEN